MVNRINYLVLPPRPDRRRLAPPMSRMALGLGRVVACSAWAAPEPLQSAIILLVCLGWEDTHLLSNTT